MAITPGKPAFYKHTLRNNYSKKIVISVRINDPDSEYLNGESELCLVTNKLGEWQFWAEKGVCEFP